MLGPIDYIIVSFKGNNFDGSILKALSKAIDDGVIRLISLAVVLKDSDGNVSTADIANLGDAYVAEFSKKYTADKSLVTKEDVDEVGELLDKNSAAGMLVVEQLWAKPLKEALLNANGTLVAEGRIHPEAAMELENKGGK